MALLLQPMMMLVLLGHGIEADTKIVSTPDGNMGPEPCVRTCSGVDNDYGRWRNSGEDPRVTKFISMSGCDFVSKPVVTAVSAGEFGSDRTCPSFSLRHVQESFFWLYSVQHLTEEQMREMQCSVYWTATGFIC